MREIKFRCWDKDEEVMFKQADIGSIDFSYKQITIENDQYSYLESYDKDGSFEIMQYTGLKDKNGEEIYEGDIISGGSGRVPTLIKWDDENNCWIAFNLRRKEEHDLDKYFNRYIGEVIGNMYENPELLKESEA